MNKPKNYKNTLEINTSADLLFEAICLNLDDWWGHQDKPILKDGDVFKVSWGEPWYQFEVIRFIKDKELIWKCIDANQKIKGLSGVEKEWVNTEIHWKIEDVSNNKCLLDFSHIGLVPDLLCFNHCSNAWTHFLKDSLIAYLNS